MKLELLSMMSATHTVSFIGLSGSDTEPLGLGIITAAASYFNFYWCFVCSWLAFGLFSSEFVKPTKFMIYKQLVLYKVSLYMKKEGLSKVPGFFMWYCVFGICLAGFILPELLPFVHVFRLNLHILMCLSLAFYVTYEVSSLTANPGWVYGLGFSAPLQALNSLSRAFRPIAMALRITLHGITSMILFVMVWQSIWWVGSNGWLLALLGKGAEDNSILFHLLSLLFDLTLSPEIFCSFYEDKSLFFHVNSGVLVGLLSLVWWLGCKFVLMTGFSCFFWVEIGFVFFQMYIFLFLVVCFSSDHPQKEPFVKSKKAMDSDSFLPLWFLGFIVVIVSMNSSLISDGTDWSLQRMELFLQRMERFQLVFNFV